MLDVHAPEHGIRDVREFFLHLFTITCGLLIALGLENAAEALHHRHARQEAEASIREEMQENRKDLIEGTPVLEGEIKNLQKMLAFVEARSLNQPADASGIDMHFREAPIQDAAWLSANSTGVVSFMDYAEVERFSIAYKEQQLLQTTEEQALNDFLELQSFAPASVQAANALSPQVAAAALPYVRHALAHLIGVYAVGKGTLGTYDEALGPSAPHAAR